MRELPLVENHSYRGHFLFNQAKFQDNTEKYLLCSILHGAHNVEFLNTYFPKPVCHLRESEYSRL